MATVRDVAESAGVSVSTVSRALSMPHMVNAATRARVVAVASELGYQPNMTARGLRMGVTNNIGLVIPDIENPYFAAVAKGVQERARKGSYAVFAADSDEDAEQEIELISSLAKQVDGMILASPRAQEERVLHALGGKPAVVLNRRLAELESIVLDNADGVRQVLDHVWALGHRKIAYAAGPRDSWSARERLAEIHHQVEIREDLDIIELGAFPPTLSGGHQAVDLALAAGVTALFAYNDLVAMGALERLRQRHVRVPDDFSLVGFDDVPLAELTYPPLTTVDVPLRAVGRQAVDALTRLISSGGRGRGSGLTVPVELRIRQSTSVPPATSTGTTTGS